jgi:adenylate cyclase
MQRSVGPWPSSFVGLSVVVGFLLASGIARSLGRASQALDRAARFDLETVPETRSAIREVAQLEDAVVRVDASLRSFARYAPEEIVRDVVLSGREAILSGERREVTVLFSDLRGFTSFAERIRPEEVVAILNDHFELLVGTIVQHRGFVVDFLGDAVFAVFGAPKRAADHVEQAVACAIEMQRARAARNETHRARGWPPLEMGTGIDTGPAVVGNMGSARRIKYGVVGHLVNAAARIETFTVGEQVLVSNGVRRALGDRLVVDGPLEAEGKGLESAMILWEVRALHGERTLVLPSAARELVALSHPLDAVVRLYLGKHLDTQSYAARVHRLGAGGAELSSSAPLEAFSAVRVHLPGLAGSREHEVDGAVVAVSERSGVPTARVRFTGVGWSEREELDALARNSDEAASKSPPP